MMRNRFDEQLARMNRELIQMGALCEEAGSTRKRWPPSPPRRTRWSGTSRACA